MKKHAQKMNMGNWSKDNTNCLGYFAVANISLISDKTEDLRCVLSI